MRYSATRAAVISSLLVTTAVASALGVPDTAVGQTLAAAGDTSDPENAALRARIKELEAENRALRAKSGPAHAAAPSGQVSAPVIPPAAPLAPAPASAFALAKVPVAVARPFDWTGPYAGLSLGVGALGAKASGSSTFTDIDRNLPTPPGLVTTDTDNTALSGNSRFEAGAIADLFIGYNFRPADRWVAGGQLEASLGRFFARFNQQGVSSFTDVRSDVGLTNISNGTFTENDSLNINFMVSALARLGFLVTPRDLVYGLAGWSYAGFDTTLPGGEDPPFGANGVTVGAGWERQILDSWTLKLEYRYTKFQTVDVSASSSSLQTDFNPPFNVAISSFASSSSQTASISPSLHVLRVGLTHYFGDDPVGPASGVFIKAPPIAARSWTGFYTGFSVGAGGMRSNATTTTSDVGVETQTVPPTGIFNEDLDNSVTTGDGRFRPGGLADLFVGYNQQAANWVGGVQVEGTVARFNELFARQRSSSETSFEVPFAGAPLSLDETFTANETVADSLSMNWMLSALGRLGTTVGPRDMIYALGGWSFASFRTSLESDDGNRTFTASGPSVGLGWERQIADMWTMRAEYRYTKFLDRTLSTGGSSTTSSSNLFGGGSTTDTSTSTSSTTVSSDMHVVRLGLARAINP